MENDVKYKDEDDRRIIEMPETFDISNHIYLKGKMIELLKDNDNHIILDMEKTEFIDSSGISIIVMLYNLLKDDERKLYIYNATGMVREALNMSKLYKYIELM
ncbi:MAG: STAS domain-containing protein [Spirochaetota bacterium]